MEEVKNKKKKPYVKPEMHVEEFTPNEYVTSCYDYEAMFHCNYGKNKQNNHGDPCANVTVSAKGVNITGHEDTEKKAGVTIFDVSLTPKQLEGASVGDEFYNVSWKSTDTVDKTGTYSHYGWAEITGAVSQIPGRPNHS